MSRDLRPRFQLETDEPADELMARMSRELRSPGSPHCGIVAEGRIELYVPPVRQHLWSPELRVDVWKRERGALLVGTYGPHPHVWMAFMAVLAFVVVAATAALTFALAEWIMHLPMRSLFALPPLVIVGGAVYSLAFIGQRFAAPEMGELRAFLEGVVQSSAPPSSGFRSRSLEVSADGARRAG